MFLLDSLMISGIRWALQTLATAAEAEMNDAAAVREQLLGAEMRREMGEISDEEFRQTEAALLARIREIRERRDGGTGPLGFAAPASGDQDVERFRVEASLTGDFHQPAADTFSQRRPGLAKQARLGPARRFPLRPEPTPVTAKPRRRKQIRPAASRARKPRT
jgi:hypothetical protein